MNPTPNTATSTRVSPHMARLWQMLNILFTIRSFEMKIAANEEKIRKCDEGTGRLLPTYTQPLKNEYLGAIASFRQRIEDEEMEYNRLLNEMALLSISEPAPAPSLPEKIERIYDDEIEPGHQRCGGHSPY